MMLDFFFHTIPFSGYTNSWDRQALYIIGAINLSSQHRFHHNLNIIRYDVMIWLKKIIIIPVNEYFTSEITITKKIWQDLPLFVTTWFTVAFVLTLYRYVPIHNTKK
jgi:hypothetical protein